MYIATELAYKSKLLSSDLCTLQGYAGELLSYDISLQLNKIFFTTKHFLWLTIEKCNYLEWIIRQSNQGYFSLIQTAFRVWNQE